MPPRRGQRAGATNTRSGGQVNQARPVVPARAPTPVPAADVVVAAPVEGVNPNARALQASTSQDGINQVLVIQVI